MFPTHLLWTKPPSAQGWYHTLWHPSGTVLIVFYIAAIWDRAMEGKKMSVNRRTSASSRQQPLVRQRLNSNYAKVSLSYRLTLRKQIPVFTKISICLTCCLKGKLQSYLFFYYLVHHLFLKNSLCSAQSLLSRDNYSEKFTFCRHTWFCFFLFCFLTICSNMSHSYKFINSNNWTP